MKTSTQLKLIGPRTFALVLLLAGLLALVGARDADAAGAIVVNSSADVAADDGLCTLREAITAANSDTASGATAGECVAGSGSDDITFAADYTITLGSELPAVASELVLTGNGAANTIIQASACDPVTLPNNCTPANYRVLEVTGIGNLTLDSVNVRHGYCSGNCSPPGYGGGIYNGYPGSLTVTNSTVSRNFARYGGGISNYGNTLTVTGSTISGNLANAPDGSGGGVWSMVGVATVNSSTLSGNYASLGGGIFIGYAGTLALSNGILSQNIASYGGGAIYIENGTASITTSTLSSNATGVIGGGIFNTGYVTVANSTLSGNTSSNRGGAIFTNGGFTGVTSSTLSGNTSPGEPGIESYTPGTFSMTNSLIIGGSRPNCHGVSADASNIADDSTCASSTVKPASAIALGPLATNGGPTPTMALGQNSAAIDAGNNSYATSAGLSTDQRGTGFARISGGTADVGAFEFQAVTLCQPGYYNNGTECVTAAPGHYVAQAGATEQTPCSVGTYQPLSGAVNCNPASPGHYVDAEAAAAQTDCALGTYQPNSGATSCDLASPGHYVDVTAATTQIDCALGSYQPNSGATSCDLASPGHYVDVTAATTQIDCALGSYQPNSGATSCDLASPGHYVDVTAATTQIDCALGAYQPNSGATSCDLASPGHYVDVTVAAAEIACVPGYYQPDGGAVSCIAASPGSYVPQSAATEQLPCPAGTTSAAATTTCTPAGYAFSGFFQPIDNLPILNSVKAGSAVPVKFSLSGNQGLNILAAGYPGSARITCDTAAPLDAVEETATAGSSGLSYDPATDVYTYVWKTNKSWAGTCRLLTVKLVDGTEHQAAFQFKR